MRNAGLPKKDNAAAWTKIASEFQELAGMPNCGCAVDGVLVPIYYITDTDPHDYFSRKGFYALNWQIVVDARLRFMYIGGALPGTVYDGHCLVATSFGRRLAAGDILPEGFYGIFDGGYSVCIQCSFAEHVADSCSLQGDARILTPYKKPPKRDLPRAQRRFNYLHSVQRGPAERALGVSKGRFRWQLRGIQLRSISSYVLWFESSCILHNMCLDAGAPPVFLDAEEGDARYTGLVGEFQREAEAHTSAGNKEFTAAISAALAQRTAVAREQAQYGLKKCGRRKAPAAVAADDDDDEPDPTGEEDQPDPSSAAADVMIDTREGAILRETLFKGLHLQNFGTKKSKARTT